ncbi:hypothetical protein HYDPIDRAFT_33668 [Hydnomerulius pinastri MD-312]|uniref:Heterokaryon incompatibility domain-containing protein n=1 Tax=Hydnomerulius pinastri MD-312 TaxID=994086 RepID=A0A0C9W7S7_9AGAM|nr:hypothetical protein HYDPIDRAFT_33950 [Hydnomerulius pinastri MD-312]KIJ58961.1 hypothetical protein HYDPIDRAFT_33668 [Hydnomerulius pinastri MD-312]
MQQHQKRRPSQDILPPISSRRRTGGSHDSASRSPQLPTAALGGRTQRSAQDDDVSSSSETADSRGSPSENTRDKEISSHVRERLLEYFKQYASNALPTHLLRVKDMRLATRDEIWEEISPQLEKISDAELKKGWVLGHMAGENLFKEWCKERVQFYVKYAIFSHRWGMGEPDFHEMSSRRRRKKISPGRPGYKKLLGFCEKAGEYECKYAWSDTCCINKESSAELEEAIRSMYRWYKDAEVCIVYLGESTTLENFEREPWFTRGWTLQELLAPKRMRFYGRDWAPICPDTQGKHDDEDGESSRAKPTNDKENASIVATISEVAGIPEDDIREFHPSCHRVAQKMGWASKRQTTRLEDVAYSLIGIFDISIPVAYGEGSRAFHKLMEAISQNCKEPEFFAWAGDPSPHSLGFPSSPACYRKFDPQLAHPLAPANPLRQAGDPSFTSTKLGLQVNLFVIPVTCFRYRPDRNNSTHSNYYRFTPTDPEDTPVTDVPLPTETFFQTSVPNNYVLGIANYERDGETRGVLRARDQYFCILLQRDNDHLGWIREHTDSVLTLYCTESITRQLETICLLHSSSRY